MKYRVYKNLHNGKWSIQDKKTGLVIGHADCVVMLQAYGVVSQAGRQRVIAEGKKNVHAFIEGVIDAVKGFVPYKDRELVEQTEIKGLAYDSMRQLTYNPYKYETFVYKDNEEKFTQTVKCVALLSNQVLALD